MQFISRIQYWMVRELGLFQIAPIICWVRVFVATNRQIPRIKKWTLNQCPTVSHVEFQIKDLILFFILDLIQCCKQELGGDFFSHGKPKDSGSKKDGILSFVEDVSVTAN